MIPRLLLQGSNKNGASPATWSAPVSQGIPDKNDILDMMVHVRRAGPTLTDSLWMFGGISIQNTKGDRYFDFEMYQTDIYYDRVSQKFYNYGPDAGHTSWILDAAGDITQAGDIIFSADYGSSTLSSLEARIWVDRAMLSIVPSGFVWSGSFDGGSPGAQYGYAGILPLNAGFFYTGTESVNNTWAGPFSLILVDNSIATTYTAGQYMEFSVNLTKLGLDPVTLLGGNGCGMPFRRVLVKSRASTSFTAELKDFVGPFDFFLAPRVLAAPTAIIYCGVQPTVINITNPSPTSTYNWTTTDGTIIGSTTADSVIAGTPGTYIVTQRLQSGCSIYAMDTVTLVPDIGCNVLPSSLVDFHASLKDQLVQLNWTFSGNQNVQYFEVERSTDNSSFEIAGRVYAHSGDLNIASYSFTDELPAIKSQYIYYRLKITSVTGVVTYSRIINISLSKANYPQISISPNPVKDEMQVSIYSPAARNYQLGIYDYTGRLLKTMNTTVQEGYTKINLTGFKSWPNGIYVVRSLLGNEIFTERILLTSK